MKIINFTLIAIFSIFISSASNASSVIANIGSTPITDTDITARTQLMAKQGQTPTDNRRQALQSIIDDHIKLKYAASLKIKPTEDEIKKQITAMDLGELTSVQSAMAKTAVSANIAWQMVIGQTIVPVTNVSEDEIKSEKQELEASRGLPIEITMLNLIDIPKSVASKLSKPKNCNDAIKIAEKLGGQPQKLTVKEYELSKDILDRISGLDTLTWTKWENDSVFLICSKKKTDEYGELDDVIKQNAVYKKAMFTADQQLKQLRRKAIIVINDNRYKL